MLYSGETIGKAEKIPNRYILRFRVNGEFDCAYKVDRSIQSICIDKHDTALYEVMLREDGEYVIGKADLN